MIVENPIFDKFILSLILLNSFIMGLTDYTGHYTDESGFNWRNNLGTSCARRLRTAFLELLIFAAIRLCYYFNILYFRLLVLILMFLFLHITGGNLACKMQFISVTDGRFVGWKMTTRFLGFEVFDETALCTEAVWQD